MRKLSCSAARLRSPTPNLSAVSFLAEGITGKRVSLAKPQNVPTAEPHIPVPRQIARRE